MSISVLPESSQWLDDYTRSSRAVPETEMQIYEVKKGECLSEIVRKMTGSNNWRPVYELNKSIIGSNPNNLVEGMMISIPNALVRDYESFTD